MKVNLSLMDLSTCNKTISEPKFERPLRFGLLRGQMCTFAPGKDTCKGDSGGPLQIVDDDGVSLIVGVTSFGWSCGSNHPGIYTRVAQYMEWIEDHVWPI